jgi:hypothetical protein
VATQSDNLFLNNSITHIKDKHTTIAKSNTNNTRHVAIFSAYTQCGQPTIRLTQLGCNAAYRSGSTFN